MAATEVTRVAQKTINVVKGMVIVMWMMIAKMIWSVGLTIAKTSLEANGMTRMIVASYQKVSMCHGRSLQLHKLF